MSNASVARKLAPLPQWNLDASHSSVTFSVRHMMISKVRGEFGQVAGTVAYDPLRPEESTLGVTLEVASINTREPKRDAHLKSADFFDAETYPQIRFESRSVEVTGEEQLSVKGDLTIRGVTRPVTLAVEGPTAVHVDPFGNRRIGASARTKIRRSDFGIQWNVALEAGGVLVGDEITIEIEASLVSA